MEGKQNLDIKLNFDKPTFYIGELLTGHIILYTEKSSVIEKILVTITLIENWDVNNKSFKPVYNSRIIGSLELDLNKYTSKYIKSRRLLYYTRWC